MAYKVRMDFLSTVRSGAHGFRYRRHILHWEMNQQSLHSQASRQMHNTEEPYFPHLQYSSDRPEAQGESGLETQSDSIPALSLWNLFLKKGPSIESVNLHADP